jgi:[acyl-carrier-protein] S-malonyltransferase
MLSPWLELPGAADQLAAWSTASGLDLIRLGTAASAEEITDTAITQPLVVAATLLAHRELTNRGLLAKGEHIVAGHSVGEIAACAIAGVISPDDAVALAATRGAEMAKACASEPTATLRQNNITAIVEFPPAGTLAGIAKRELKGVPGYAIKTPADLAGLAELEPA